MAGARSRFLLLPLNLLVVSFAGCVGGGAQADEEQADGAPRSTLEQSIEDAPPTASVAEGAGAIQGVVFNENQAPLRGAFVALLGTDNSTETDKLGRFAFSNLAPRAYTLRVDASGYQSLEQGVDVVEGRVTNVTITLASLGSEGAGFREHLHDFWAGETEKVLFDSVLSWERTITQGHTEMCAASISVSSGGRTCNILPVPIPDGTIVWPGTALLRITINWQRRDFVREVDFQYQPASEIRFRTGLLIKPAETKEIPVELAMTDHGHQKFTLWAFRVYAQPKIADAANVGQPDLNRNIVGDVSVKILAVKGVVPGEPAHVRFWKDGDRIVLVEKEEHKVNGLSFPNNRNPKQESCLAYSNCFTLPKGVIVPPGTTGLDVRLEYRPGTAAADPIFSEKALSFRTAAIRPSTATFDSLRVENPTAATKGKVEYSLKLDPKETDAFYQTRSLWLFLLANRGKERSPDFVNECFDYVATICGGAYFTLHVEAVNENWDAMRAAGQV